MPPREIRMGEAEMVIQAVEPDVAPEEVAQAVQRLISEENFCLPWPALWLEAETRRDVFVVRYDLMRRDWGEVVANGSERRMEEFVDLGYLVRRERSEIGPGAVMYTLTSMGADFLSGSPYRQRQVSFCMPSERRLLQVTGMEWGTFDCGSLRVSFTHVNDAWPLWARTDAARSRLAQAWSPVGEPSSGSVTLSRHWVRMRGANNGMLRSVCYDPVRDRVTGDDLTMNVARPAADQPQDEEPEFE